jgi:hypothetical protein
MPLEGVQVRLWGKYIEEWVGRSGDQVGIPLEPQEKEFEMGTTTDSDGVVVFALSWRKEYPWSSYFKDQPPREYRKDGSGYSTKQSWIRAVDDIEKVQRIEIRHPKYGYKEISFNFSHLLEFGQSKDSETQSPELFDRFEEAWHKEIQRENVKFCVLSLGTKFPDFQNKSCSRPEFFEKICQKDWGTAYQKPENWFSAGEYPQSECGPYLVYSIERLPIEKKATEIEVTTQGENKDYPSSGITSESVAKPVTKEKPQADWLLMRDEIPKGFSIAEPSYIEGVKKTDFEETPPKGLKSVYLAVYQAEKDVELFLYRVTFYSKLDLDKYIETSKGEIKRTIDLGPGVHGNSYIRCFTNNNDVASSVILEIGGRSYVQDVDRCIEKYRKRLGLVDVIKWAMESQEADNDETSKFVSVAQKDPFGIAVTDLKKERAVSLGLPPAVAANFAGSEGLIIEYVIPDSPAYQAGLRKDCIITIAYYPDGYQQHLFDMEDYQKALQLIKQKNAQEVKLKYWQFPQPFNGEIDYNKHLKETKIQLKPGKVAETRAGSLVAWGDNKNGECDAPSRNDFIAIAAGGNDGKALRADGSPLVWRCVYDKWYVNAGKNFATIASGGVRGYTLAIKKAGQRD